MANIEIRPTQQGDLPRLMAIDHKITTEYVWQLEFHRDGTQMAATFRDVRLPRPIVLNYPSNPYALADVWKQKSLMLTAAAGQTSIGYLCLTDRSAQAAGWITDVVVGPDWRRRGVAAALLASAQEWCQTRSHRRIFIEIPAKNQPAIQLVLKHGYEFCGYNDHYYPTQDVALFFVRGLK